MKIFNVSIPEEALNYDIPLMTIWFALNYFYYMYAEYTLWKAKYLNHLKDIKDGINLAKTNFMGGENSLTNKESFGITKWQHTTLIPEIREMTENNIKVKTCFGTYLGMIQAKNKPKGNEEVIKVATEQFQRTINEFFISIKSDVERIKSFQSAIHRFNFANKLRFYLFDLIIPSLVMLISLALAIAILFYNKSEDKQKEISQAISNMMHPTMAIREHYSMNGLDNISNWNFETIDNNLTTVSKQ